MPIWENEGRPEARHLDHWLRAEAEINRPAITLPVGTSRTTAEIPVGVTKGEWLYALPRSSVSGHLHDIRAPIELLHLVFNKIVAGVDVASAALKNLC